MRHRSLRRARTYAQERRALVEAFLQERPICERCSAARSVDVHELKSRARGGSILDEDNLAALCRECHDFVTQHPTQALEEGWARSSWWQPEQAESASEQQPGKSDIWG